MVADKTTATGDDPELWIKGADLSPCTCLACRRVVYHWRHGIRTDGRAFTFEVEEENGPAGRDLHIHDCVAEDHSQLWEWIA
jgi:hypothetical protein